MTLCSSALLLQEGAVVMNDAVGNVVDTYLGQRGRMPNQFAPEASTRKGDGQARITGFRIARDPVVCSEPCEFEFTVQRPQGDADTLRCDLAISILTQDASPILRIYSGEGGKAIELPPGESRVKVALDRVPLVPGTYSVNLWVGWAQVPFDWLLDCVTLIVASPDAVAVDGRGYPVVTPARWSAPRPVPADRDTARAGTC